MIAKFEAIPEIQKIEWPKSNTITCPTCSDGKMARETYHRIPKRHYPNQMKILQYTKEPTHFSSSVGRRLLPTMVDAKRIYTVAKSSYPEQKE